MEIRAHYVAVGAFVLLMVVLAFVTVLWLARGELTTQQARYDIYFGGPVFCRGYRGRGYVQTRGYAGSFHGGGFSGGAGHAMGGGFHGGRG